MCKECIKPAKFEDLVSSCVELVQNDVLREGLQQQAFNSIARYPQELLTQAVLD